MNNNDILKSLEEEKAKLENEFKIYSGQLNQLEDNMASVQHEYEMKKENLKANIERIRGAYTVVYNQLDKFGAIVKEEPEAQIEEQQKDVNKTEKVKADNKVKTNKKTSDIKVDDKKEKTSVLTQDEIDKINNAVTNKKSVKDANGNEIPEYLRAEYKK